MVNKQNWTAVPKKKTMNVLRAQQKEQQVFEWMPIGKGEHRMKTLGVDTTHRTGTKKMSGYSWELKL